MLCKLAKVTKSGYYKWLSRSKSECLVPHEEEIIHMFRRYKSKKGARTIKMRLERDLKIIVNLKKIRRVMRKHNLITKIRKRNPYRHVFKTGENHKFVSNILKRDFIVPEADRVYSTDITYLFYGKGQVAYLSAVKDLGTSEIVHHNVFNRINTELATRGLENLFQRLPKEKLENLVLHSDQGSNYTATNYRQLLKKYRVTQSMSRRGNCLDNAPIESFFGHLKDEVDLSDCKSLNEVVTKIEEYINYYNNDRPQWALKGKTPAECRGFLEVPFY